MKYFTHGMKNTSGMVRLTAVVLFSCAPKAGAEEGVSNAPTGNWTRLALVGIAAAPTYFGDDQLQGTALPDIQFEYTDRFRASLLSGAELTLYRNDKWSAGTTLRYDFGRDERRGNPLVVFGSETEDLLGLGNVNGSFEVGGFLSYNGGRWKSALEVRHGLSGGHEGLIGALDLKYNSEHSILGRRSYLEIGPELLYGDNEYNRSYFGITTEQSQNSGLSKYNANSGIVRYGIHADLLILLSQKTSVGLFANFDRLGPVAADSPLIIERGSEDQLVSGLFIAREF